MVQVILRAAKKLCFSRSLLYLAILAFFGYLVICYGGYLSTSHVQQTMEMKSHLRNYNGQREIIDYDAPSAKVWTNDVECEKFQVHFAINGSFKPRALVSYSGSGNSWLRYLIECATGFFTGSVYREKRIYEQGLLGEYSCPEDGTTILQKTHDQSPETILQKCRQKGEKFPKDIFVYDGILIIRNPYDSIISNWNLKQSNDQRGHANETTFSQEEWRTFAMKAIPRWSSLIIAWMENSEGRLLIIEYEKLKANPRSTLVQILQYLNHAVNESRLDCLMKPEHIEGSFHRNHKNKTIPISAYYTDSIHILVQKHITRINSLFTQRRIPIILDYQGPSN